MNSLRRRVRHLSVVTVSFLALGKYTVKTTDDSEQCVELGQVAVQVKNAPVTVQPDIKLFGHSLRVVVTDPGNRPLSRASTTLVSAKQLQVRSSVTIDKSQASELFTEHQF